MKLLRVITDKDITGSGAVAHAPPRRTARAVVLDNDGNIAVMHIGAFGIYMLPGGGVEDGEDLLTAVKREVSEETGCDCEIIGEIGYTEENRAEHDFTQIAYFYLTRVVGAKRQPQMSEEENEQRTTVGWYTPARAYDLIKNQVPTTYQQRFLSFRDSVVMDEAMKLMQDTY